MNCLFLTVGVSFTDELSMTAFTALFRYKRDQWLPIAAALLLAYGLGHFNFSPLWVLFLVALRMYSLRREEGRLNRIQRWTARSPACAGGNTFSPAPVRS